MTAFQCPNCNCRAAPSLVRMLTESPDNLEIGCVECGTLVRFSRLHTLFYSCCLLALYFLPVILIGRENLDMLPVILWTILFTIGMYCMYAYLIPIRIVEEKKGPITFYKSPIFWFVIPISVVAICLAVFG